MDAQARKSAVAWLSVISNITLVILKIIVGIAIGSVSVISEAIHSGVDLVAAIIALFAVKTSSKPADRGHPFGHGKVENISGTVEALLIFLAAGWIIYEAVKKLYHPEPIETAGLGVGVMFLSATANMFVSHRLFKVGKETHSVALQADAWHLRTDVYTSAGVMLGLLLLTMGDWLSHWLGIPWLDSQQLQWLDPAAAIAVAMLIIRAAYDLTVQSARDLLDVTLPAEEEEWIDKLIRGFHPTVAGFHGLRTRKAGHVRFVEFHMIVEPGMTVKASHDIAESITAKIEEHFADSHVAVHVEPCEGDCTEKCTIGCLLPEHEQQKRKVNA